jgi:hypothetical protein
MEILIAIIVRLYHFKNQTHSFMSFHSFYIYYGLEFEFFLQFTQVRQFNI